MISLKMAHKASKKSMQLSDLANRVIKDPCPEIKWKGVREGSCVTMGVNKVKLTNDPCKKTRNFRGCFACHGPHYVQDCPLRRQVSSMKIEGNIGETQWISTPEKGKTLLECDTLGGSTEGVTLSKGLMYVQCNINDHDVKAFVDTRATHNFIQMETVKRFRLNISPSDYIMKYVNTVASRSHGVAKNVTIGFDAWKGNVDFLVITLDDFEVILGDEFLGKAKVMVLPHLGGILIGDEGSPCFFKAVLLGKKETGPFLSAMKAKKGARKGVLTFIVVLVDTKPGQTVDI